MLLILNITDQSDEPLQSQISRQIRAKILSGDLPTHSMLPSIRNLARKLRVSVVTVQRGYDNLEREGLIHSRRGKGFFVSPIKSNDKKKMAVQMLQEALGPILKRASEEGLSIEEIKAAIDGNLVFHDEGNGLIRPTCWPVGPLGHPDLIAWISVR